MKIPVSGQGITLQLVWVGVFITLKLHFLLTSLVNTEIEHTHTLYQLQIGRTAAGGAESRSCDQFMHPLKLCKSG